MKLIASAALSMRASALLVLAIVSGCALPLPDKPVRPTAYDLGAPLATPASAAAGAPLAFDRVEAPAAIDTSALIYRLQYAGGEQQPRPYAQARWSMSPPQLLGQRLREALAATRPVLEPGAGLAALELRADLDEFDQVFSAPSTSEGVVRLRVTVLAPQAKQNRLLGQRSFVQRRLAPTADAPGGAQALREATDALVREVVDWVGTLAVPRS